MEDKVYGSHGAGKVCIQKQTVGVTAIAQLHI